MEKSKISLSKSKTNFMSTLSSSIQKVYKTILNKKFNYPIILFKFGVILIITNLIESEFHSLCAEVDETSIRGWWGYGYPNWELNQLN